MERRGTDSMPFLGRIVYTLIPEIQKWGMRD
jgi:hypothetical protein